MLPSPVSRAALSYADNGRRYISGARLADGKYAFVGFDTEARITFICPLPARGHAPLVDPAGRRAILFARRPGTFAGILDFYSGSITGWLEAPPGRHFQGHGAFSTDGGTLYSTENDFEQGRGVIGVWQVNKDIRRIGEIESHGIGAHEIRVAPDGLAHIVANGGVLTHPETGRRKLNVPGMSPSLVYIDPASGKLMARHRVPRHLHKLSIRHIDVAADSTVGMALQYEGPKRHDVPLVAIHRPGTEISLLSAPRDINRRMNQYCGSIRLEVSSAYMGVTCPRGDLVTFWRLPEGEFAGSLRHADACGIVPTAHAGEFLISGGRGDLAVVHPSSGSRKDLAKPTGVSIAWDNHLLEMAAVSSVNG